MLDFMDILLICGKKCNFRCKYCYTKIDNSQPYVDSTNVLLKDIDLIFKHINYYVERTKKVKLTFYGGEPLIYIDFVKAVVERYIDVSNVEFCLVTNGTKLIENFDIFKDIPKQRILFCISYDYSNQDVTRHPNTYHTVRNAIRFVARKGFKVKTITVLDAKTIRTLESVYRDYCLLTEERNGKINARVNIYEESFKNDESTLNDQNLIDVMKMIQANNKQDRFNFTINDGMLNRKVIQSNKSFLQSTYAICPDGTITQDCKNWFFDNYRPYLSVGTIYEDPEIVYNNRVNVINQLGPVSQTCVDCPSKSCKSPPFEWRQNQSPLYWCTPPDKENEYFCRVSTFFSQYLGNL